MIKIAPLKSPEGGLPGCINLFFKNLKPLLSGGLEKLLQINT